MAQHDGGASTNDSGKVGNNAKKHWVIRMLNRSHEVSVELIGHWLRGELQEIFHRADEAVPAAQTAEQDALDSIDDHLKTAIEKEEVREEIKAEGLKFPHWIAHSVLYIVALIALGLSDLAFLATTFMLFGFSDTKILGIPYTDELHLASMGSLTALFVLAHFAGKFMRATYHDAQRRRKTKVDEKQEKLRPRSWLQLIMAIITSLVGVLLLVAVSVIRAKYLETIGVEAQTLPFFLIQLAILAAAIALAFLHAHPYGREWVDTSRRERRDAQTREEKCNTHCDAVATVNALADECATVIAQAGHHFRASRYDVLRQAALYARDHFLCLPEQTNTEIFPGEFEEPNDLNDDTMAKRLIGITAAREIARMSTDPVTKRRAEARDQLRQLRFSKAGGGPEESPQPDDSEPRGPEAAQAEESDTPDEQVNKPSRDPFNGAEAATITVAAPPEESVSTNGGWQS